MDEWLLGPPVLIGDRVAFMGTEEPLLATVRWLGRLPDVFHHQLVAGIALVGHVWGSCRVQSRVFCPGRAADTGHHKRNHWWEETVPVSPEPWEICPHLGSGQGGGFLQHCYRLKK